VRLRSAVAIEQAPHEGEERDPLELTASLGVAAVLRAAEGRLELLGVAQRLGGERGDDLTEAHIAVRERLGVALGPEKDRADHGAAPTDRNHDDRADVAKVEQRLDVREHRVVGGVGHEDRFAGLEGTLQLGVAIQVDDEIANRRIFVARDEADIARLTGEEDRAAIEAEGVAQLAGDRLENVYEVEGGRDFLENIDERDQLVTLALQLRDLSLQSGDRPTGGRPLRRGRLGFPLICHRAGYAR
jgi:hypothetical protein